MLKLPPGTYTIMVRHFDYSAYSWKLDGPKAIIPNDNDAVVRCSVEVAKLSVPATSRVAPKPSGALGKNAANLADNAAGSLTEAVWLINVQAAKLPEGRAQKPLTEDEVVKAIRDLDREKPRLSDAKYQELQQIAETHRLPKNAYLRPFVRYNDGTGVQHGWWVQLLVERTESPYGTFVLTIRQAPPFHRPYTQKERLFREEFGRTGAMPLINRLVAYFDEDPKFGVQERLPQQAADRLADSVKKAIIDKSADNLLAAYHWEGVDKETRAAVSAEAKRLVTRPLASLSVSPRRFSGRLSHRQAFATFDPNLPVLGYVVLEFADKQWPTRSGWSSARTRASHGW